MAGDGLLCRTPKMTVEPAVQPFRVRHGAWIICDMDTSILPLRAACAI